MRKNNPLKPHRQRLRKRPDIILDRVDWYEERIQKYLRPSYKGRLQEKWKDLAALYKAVSKKDSLKRPLHRPSLKSLKYMSKRTLAVLCFASSHDLRFTKIKEDDNYWRKRREALEELIPNKPRARWWLRKKRPAGKKMSRKEYKEKRKQAWDYHQMLKRARKATVTIHISKEVIREISRESAKEK